MRPQIGFSPNEPEQLAVLARLHVADQREQRNRERCMYELLEVLNGSAVLTDADAAALERFTAEEHPTSFSVCRLWDVPLTVRVEAHAGVSFLD